MASYEDLYKLAANTKLQQRTIVAVEKQAVLIVEEDVATANHANRLIWAAGVLRDPGSAAKAMLHAVLAINSGLTTEQILGASDADIQANVATTVDLFATG